MVWMNRSFDETNCDNSYARHIEWMDPIDVDERNFIDAD